MQTPITAELCTAIKVLKQLVERLNANAEHSAMQLAESPVGTYRAGLISVSTIDSTSRVQGLVTQLEQWRSELNQHRRNL